MTNIQEIQLTETDLKLKQNNIRTDKKCRKALKRAGMKNMTGVSKVIIQKEDGLSYVIDCPEMLNIDCSYAFFGELKL